MVLKKITGRVVSLGIIGWLTVLPAAGSADDGQFRNSPHGSTSDGVLRTTDLPQGSCAQCHTAHDGGTAQPFGLFQENSNQLCFTASQGGCHADQPAGASSGYPAQESDRMPEGSADPGYFEFNSSGTRIPGLQNLVRWPGQVIWENGLYSQHYSDPDMPIKDVFGWGACDNCHSVHGSLAPHDMLDTTYSGITGSGMSATPENYALCFSCHNDLTGPIGMDDSSRMIAYFYDRSINVGPQAGHGVSTGGGYVAPGSRLPCYDCHNPHGSVGYGGLGGNGYLLSDQRPGWYGLIDIKNDNAQVRRFCSGCHPPSDVASTGTVEGLSLSPLPALVGAHASTSDVHCYECHGRDYDTPTSRNVHNPDPGGDCIGCHSTERGPRRAVVTEFELQAHHVAPVGQTDSVTNNDCGVCHMEGSAISADVNSVYHANGLLELRHPDNGMALPGFADLTRDLYSAALEPWVLDVQNDFCLACHDANGALSLEARVPGGTAQAPFSVAGAVVIDVNSQFAPTNQSYHPVRAVGNNPYTVPGTENNFTPTLLPPFNQTQAHDPISCFDCHETSGHGSANTGMLLVETYFREATLHPSFWTAQQEFCGRCHNLTYYTQSPAGVSRFENHDKPPHVEPGGVAKNSLSCRGCHAGIYDYDQDTGCDNASGIGRIHGYTHINSACSPTPGTQPAAFLFGGYMNGWQFIDAQNGMCYANCHHSAGVNY